MAEIQDPLYVITVISNPQRYESRYRLYKEFRQRIIKNPHATLYTVEVAFGERKYSVTHPSDACNIRFFSFDELWHKENMINLAMSRLPQDWKYVAWIDADVRFMNDDWAMETLNQLQHYMFVQMFEDAIDLGPEDEFIQRHKGFVKAYIDNGFKFPNQKPAYYEYPGIASYAHPGYAWAARREAIDYVGGLIDYAILGSADYHMATALIGEVEQSYALGADSKDRYLKKLKIWQDRCTQYIKYDIGYCPGSLVHYWHGKKRDRGYKSRWDILREAKFDPDNDIKRDTFGLWQLSGNNDVLRDGVREYFKSRREDSIDT